MLDTNICIYVINERDEALGDQLLANASELCISAITYAELCYGVSHSRRVQHNTRELDAFEVDLNILPFGRDAGKHYGRTRHALARRGALIGANDLLIAAHARSIDATLVTNNVGEFTRVPQLRVENWPGK